MKAHELSSSEIGPEHLGWILTADLRDRDRRRFMRKGATIDEAALADWLRVAEVVLHLIEPEPGDLHEDVAGRRLAEVVAGTGILIRPPVQSRLNLASTVKGLLSVDRELLLAINRIEGLTAFSLLDRQPVLPGKIVAGVKTTPITVREELVLQAEQLVTETGHKPVEVLGYEPQRVAVFATEGLNERTRARFREVIQKKLRWYGSELVDLRFIETDASAVAATLQEYLDAGADVIFAAGGNTIDPLDPILVGLQRSGAEMVHFGAPAHPGSMFWVARIGRTPVVNLASCSMYSRSTVADLVLPTIMTGRGIESEDVVQLAYGGVLDREMSFRFPDYDVEEVDEPDEEE